MRGIILAAGRGSRMGSLTDAQPKCLLRVGGRSLLEWQLSAFREAGIEDIGIVTGYRRDLLIEYGLEEFHNPRWAETNMVASLSCAEKWLLDSDCIVSYSDIFFEPSGVRSLIVSRASLAVLYDPLWRELWTPRFGDPLIDSETFVLNADSSLAQIGASPQSLDQIQGQYMGLLRFSPRGWREVGRCLSAVSEDRHRIHMTGLLQVVIDAGKIPVEAIPYGGRWGEVDSESDLLFYNGQGTEGKVGGDTHSM